MSNEPNKKRIGLFLIVGFLCFFGLIGKFVIVRIMPNNQNVFVMFFDESVKGLNIGSPVVLEGVEVGKVTQISLVTDPDTLAFSIPVYVRFKKDERTSDLFQSVFGRGKTKEQIISELIDKGLRARLVSQNFLTGQLMIELVMQPNAPLHLVDIPQAEGLIQIPTVLSTIGELSKGIQDLPLKAMVNKLNNILNVFETELPAIFPQFKLLGENLNKAVPAFTLLGQKMNKTVDKIDGQVPKTTATINHLNTTLDDISHAAKALRNLADYLERHPESLLRGK